VRELFSILRTVNEREHVSMLVVEQNAAMALDLSDHAYLHRDWPRGALGNLGRDQENDAVRRSYLGY
jgi:branched-chain amino acid transport system ATP-binding protein